jgi:NTP pyrophosphatase (non-canonical NTP hydrolase)
LGSEVGELQAEFRWLTEEETINLTSDKLNSIKDEIADVAIFLFRISDLLKIDLNLAIREKISINDSRIQDGPNFKK